VLYFGLDDTQASRDKRKAELSKLNGITLIVIPYWWQFSKDFLYTLIAKLRPDIPLPKFLPTTRVQPPTKDKVL
jgi:hypothetical protein